MSRSCYSECQEALDIISNYLGINHNFSVFLVFTSCTICIVGIAFIVSKSPFLANALDRLNYNDPVGVILKDGFVVIRPDSFSSSQKIKRVDIQSWSFYLKSRYDLVVIFHLKDSTNQHIFFPSSEKSYSDSLVKKLESIVGKKPSFKKEI